MEEEEKSPPELQEVMVQSFPDPVSSVPKLTSIPSSVSGGGGTEKSDK